VTRLYSATVSRNAVRYVFDKRLHRHHIVDDLFIEYEQGLDLSDCSDALLAVPVLVNLAPIVWLSGDTFSVPALDATLAKSLEGIRLELASRYPAASWEGQLVPDRVEATDGTGTNGQEDRVALLFSAGLDSVHSSLALGGRQLLIAGWGNDISFENARGWARIARDIKKFAEIHGHETTWFRSNFRRVANEKSLLAASGLHNWWGQVQHAMGLVGIAAPALSFYGARTLFISGFGSEGATIPWGSDPEIVEAIGWDAVSVQLFGVDVTRQEKTAFVASRFANRREAPPYIHVCWMDPDSNGLNCCRCQKCLRTAVSLAVEDECYERYGFPISPSETSLRIAGALKTKTLQVGVVDVALWADLQARIKELLASANVEERRRAAPFDWLLDVDFGRYRQEYTKRARLKGPVLRALALAGPVERLARRALRSLRRLRRQY
jgi:hypothetical protein